MRLDKYLADLGIGTRSEIKNNIKKGRVQVNGERKVKPEMQVTAEDEILFDGKPCVLEEFEYWLLYKPAGYLSATEDRHKPVVMELVPSNRKDLSPVGRLDEDTEGFLLITNDGDLNHRVLSPKRHVKKKYYAKLDHSLPENAKEILEAPIEFQEFTSLPAEFEKITDTEAYLTITEGKFHQVKRMFAHIGCEVTYLKRISFGPLTLEGMKVSEARPLTADEISKLKAGMKE